MRVPRAIHDLYGELAPEYGEAQADPVQAEDRERLPLRGVSQVLPLPLLQAPLRDAELPKRAYHIR